MLKRLLKIFAIIIAILLLALACWAAGFYYDWRDDVWIWTFLAITASVILLFYARRRWKVWRIRKKMAEHTMVADEPDYISNDWYAGIQTLKDSRLSRAGSPLYGLPWLLAIGHDSRATAALFSELTVSQPISGNKSGQEKLRWWPLKQCVVIEPLETPNANNNVLWSRLFKLMGKTRRREPLNGVIITLDSSWLMSASAHDLNEYGKTLRERINGITKVYGVRVPVYMLVTGAETLSGMQVWTNQLDEDKLQQPMGYVPHGEETDVDVFIHDAFSNMQRRLLDLRLLQSGENQLSANAINLPNHLFNLETPLQHVFKSAFSTIPYAETPLVRGVFLTAKSQLTDGQDQALFAHTLFDQLIPKKRFSWQRVHLSRQWKRFLRNAVAVVWLLACAAVGFLLYSSADLAESQLNALTPLNEKQYDNTLNHDTQLLFAFRNNVKSFSQQRTLATAWLPYQDIIANTEKKLELTFSDDYEKQIIDKQIDPLFKTSFPQVHHSNSNPLLLAAWVELLVRRINLIDAAVKRKNVDQFESFTKSLPPIFQSANVTAPSELVAADLTDMYKSLVKWEVDDKTELFKARKKQLFEILNGLKLDVRSTLWLDSWVKMQGYISSVKASDYWDIDVNALPTAVSPSFTQQGFAAIKAFLKELDIADGATLRHNSNLMEHQQRFLTDGLDQWQMFLRVFPDGMNYLASANSRTQVLSDIATLNGPYLSVLKTLGDAGTEVDKDIRPGWVSQVITFNQTVKNSQTQVAKSAIKETTQIGEKILKKVDKKGRLGQKLNNISLGESLLTDLQAYKESLKNTVYPLLQGPGTSMKATREIWSYGHNPDVKEVPFFDAQKHLNSFQDKLSDNNNGLSIVEDSVLRGIISGPLDFVLDYSIRSAACDIQKQWEANVVNAVAHIHSKRQMREILFGDKGQIKAFLDGDIKDFIDQSTNGYAGRMVNGKALPLNSQFYAFLNSYQRNHANLINQADQTIQQQNDIETLTKENSVIEQQLAKSEKIEASVTLTTEPAQVNKGAKILPQSVTLALQCAGKSYQLENLNFTNSGVFSWSSETCSDTVLSITFNNGLIVKKQWGGTNGFIDFLNTFSGGRHTYSSADFPAAEKMLNNNNLSDITLVYLQQGKVALLDSLNKVEKLKAKIKTNEETIQYFKDVQSGKIENESPEEIFLPQRIIRYCMEPIKSHQEISQSLASANEGIEVKRPASVIRATGEYIVQIGIFKSTDKIIKQLGDHGITAKIAEDVRLKNHEYKKVVSSAYPSKKTAEEAKHNIDKILRLRNKSVIIRKK